MWFCPEAGPEPRFRRRRQASGADPPSEREERGKMPRSHEDSRLCFLVQRLTLAPAPPMMASTSLRDAMEVSPGVVMARAPWAAP